ncbi:hypothetical protein [Gilliamella apicola]|uniref:Uncharacterized protein n=1 Tax=Gilliamella apicola TaxID=1196095 RepID=A0A2V4DVE2_9GAMM|nr:hypothetical protein [Gilliamella apicola]PXZ04760.1 hypothetical protein DKK79_10490 [Gilliamella apicola]
MIRHIDAGIANKILNIDNNYQLALLDGFNDLFKKEPLEVSRNIFLIKTDGQVIWRIYSKNDKFGDSFTNIYEKDGKFKAYRWDGGQYDIDIETGLATPEILIR